MTYNIIIVIVAATIASYTDRSHKSSTQHNTSYMYAFMVTYKYTYVYIPEGRNVVLRTS